MSRAFASVNHAKALYEISTQASVYVPMLATPSKLPNYVNFDKSHAWHTSALQVTGFESVMLPTRLKVSGGDTATTLDHLAITLAGSEERRIAGLRFEVEDVLRTHPHTNGSSGAHDDSAQSTAKDPDSICDMFSQRATDTTTLQSGQKFAKVDCFRGEMRHDENVTSETRVEETRDRQDDFRKIE